MTPEQWINLGGLGAFAMYVGAELRAMRRAWERIAVALGDAYPQIAESIPPPVRGHRRRHVERYEDTEPERKS